MPLVAGARCSLAGKDAGSVNSRTLLARLRTPPADERRGSAAQTVFRQTLLPLPLAGQPERPERDEAERTLRAAERRP
jgi:hypothetical protein